MAKDLIFNLLGTEYGAAPVKLERKKVYGWSDIVATNKEGNHNTGILLYTHERHCEA